MAKAVSLVHSPRRWAWASPKVMAPRQKGETRREAEGASWRWGRGRDFGVGKPTLVVVGADIVGWMKEINGREG